GRPTVRVGIVSPAGVQIAGNAVSPPYNHFTAAPHRCVVKPANRRVGGACGRPAVRAWIVPRPGVFRRTHNGSAPDNHFNTSPQGRVTTPTIRRTDGAWGNPTVDTRSVSPASVQIADAGTTKSAPDDHFTASPQCPMVVSRSRCINPAGGCPSIVGTS